MARAQKKRIPFPGIRHRPGRPFLPSQVPATRDMQQVDQEGIEPSSKQGNHMLSTRLASLGFSSTGKTEATNRHLIP